MKTKTIGMMALLCGAGLYALQARADEPKYQRSSIYTVLVNSDKQNQKLDAEAKEAQPEEYAKTIAESKEGSIGAIPKAVFPFIPIPEQFNDHNLGVRILDFDAITAEMTEADAAAAKPAEKKKGGFGKFAKAVAGAAMGGAVGTGSALMGSPENARVDEYIFAANNKFFEDNKTAPMMVAKWFNYSDSTTPHFNDNVITERGLTNASAADLAKAATNDQLKASLGGQGFNLLNNTYVMATNLRFRNNKALAKEISDLAAMAAAAAGGGGMMGQAATLAAKKGTEMLLNALMKDLYSVSAVTTLYQLEWNDDIADALGEKVLYNDNATLDDLLNSGMCKLKYVAQTKSRSGVKKNKEKSLEQLAGEATSRAIDASLAKLQVEYEPFRTSFPISSSEDGFAYAKIGSKEGVMPGDEYQILEERSDPKTGRTEFKSIGKATVEKDGVWFNTVGADEIIATADEKEAPAMQAAKDLGATKFKVSKKGDLSGYYLRLDKKKGKIE